MQIITDHIWPDEGCWGLAEGPLTMPHGEGFQRRWVQRVFVVRGDAIAKYTVDLGSAEYWEERALPQVIAGFGEDTVAELQEWAERDRNKGRLWQFVQEQRENSTLIEDSIAGLEQELLAKRNHTTIGPHVFSQRGDYPGQHARRVLRGRQKERINGRNN